MSSAAPVPPTLHFDCPACGVTLAVPAAAAGLQGPCPRCWQEIVSPDPAQGIPARLPAPPSPPVPSPEPPAVSETPAPVEAPAPIEPPQPPASHVHQPQAEAPPVATASLPSRGWWALTWIVTAVAFGGAGYYLRMRQMDEVAPFIPKNTSPAAPAPKSDSASTLPPSQPEPVKPPETTPPPEPPPATPAKLDSDHTLRAFLEAPDWKARMQYVVIPEQVGELMEKRAAESGDGPIAYTGISLATIKDGTHLYIVRTTDIPDGVVVGVVPTEEGPKVDWEAFIGFYQDDFRKFYDGPAGQKGIFMLHVKPSAPPEGEAESHFLRFRLAPPMPDRDQLAWIRKDSPALPKFRAVTEGGAGLNKNEVAAALAGDGVPMVVALEKKANGVGQTFLEITDFIKVGWGPAAK